MNSEKIFSLEKKFLMQTYKRYPIAISHGKGSKLFSPDGTEYIDFLGGIAVCSIGHSNPVAIDAIKQQSGKLISTSNYLYNEPAVLLAEKISKISKLQKSFLSNSGAEAVECAIKLARAHTKKKEIIVAKNAFHGRTMGALSATWEKKYKKFCQPLVPGFKAIEYNNVSALKKAIGKNTAAFLIEPIQGEAGIIVPEKGYLKEVSEICDKKGILFVCDEIQSGCARTGKFFAFQHEKVLPDIITQAKGIANGIPIGVTTAKKGIDFEKGQHGTTFGGNPFSCAVSLAVIDYIEKNKLAKKAEENGKYFSKELNESLEGNKKVKEIRGKGLLIGIESTVNSDKILKKCLKKHLIASSMHKKVIRLLPPLTVSKKEIDEGIEILKECFKLKLK